MAPDLVLRTSVVVGRPNNNTISQYIYAAAISRGSNSVPQTACLAVCVVAASSTMSPPPPPKPLIATVIRSSGETPPVSCSTTSPNATALVRSVVGVAIIVSSCVSPRPPLKVKLLGETSISNPGVIAVPEAVQLVASVRVFRTVRVQVQLGVQSMLRTAGRFKVLGSPPVAGFAAM